MFFSILVHRSVRPPEPASSVSLHHLIFRKSNVILHFHHLQEVVLRNFSSTLSYSTTAFQLPKLNLYKRRRFYGCPL